MKYKKEKLIIFLITSLSLIVISVFHLNQNYTVLGTPVDVITIQLNKRAIDVGVPIMYANKDNSPDINFTDVYRFRKVNDSTVQIGNLQIDSISKFRIYFELPGDGFEINQIEVSNNSESKVISLYEVRNYSNIKIHEHGSFDVNGLNGYIEYPYMIVNKIPYFYLSIGILLFLFLLGNVVFKTNILDQLIESQKKDYIFIIFLLSIYLDEPIYNIALILACLYYIRDFNWKLFKENKINFFILFFFFIYLLNVIFIQDTKSNDFSTIERFLPFVFIPILLVSNRISNALYFLMISGLFICIYLFLIAILNLLLLGNIEYLSFSVFSEKYHPVYLSYLVFFSICCLELDHSFKGKFLIEGILFVSLIFLGSKLVLFISIPLFCLLTIKLKRKQIPYFLLGGVLVFSLFLFKPLKERFMEVLDIDDMSIVNEYKIDNPNDPRINGLTLRLILWREALATMDSFSEVLIGNGVSKFKRSDLKDRMNDLGLKYQSGFNPHNQFVNTFWETGLIGLSALIFIFLQTFKMSAFSYDNRLLLVFTIFFIISMFTESIFGRVRGVYIFTTLLLILTNTNLNYKKIQH